MRNILHSLTLLTLFLIPGLMQGQHRSESTNPIIPATQKSAAQMRSVKSVSPLLSTRWGEGCLYNANCPIDTASHSTCLHTPAGSGAVAMAQIMKFYGYPVHGIGEHGYPHPKYGIQYANFSATTYNWNQMPDTLVSANSDLSTLMYHCGVAQDMNYGPESSVSLESALDTALIKYFGFPKTAVWKNQSAYSITNWVNMLKAELDASHPVLYSGSNYNGTKQRFFICDGYQGEDSFHFNWCSNGEGNGYYSLVSLKPDTINFAYSQRAIFGLAPSPPAPASVKMDFENVSDFSRTFNDWTVRDLDLHDTYSIDNYTFPHQNEPMAFLCFNPALVTPTMASDQAIQPHGGQRFGACFSSNPPTNNDWFISPQVQLGVNGTFSFWIKSYTDTWGLDSYKVAVSVTDSNPASFTVISGTDPLQTTTAWTRKVFNLTAYNNQKVYVAIQCVSNDHFL